MVLHRSNFEIPARLSFQPFPAEWRSVTAETMEWAKDPTKLLPSDDDPNKDWLRVRVAPPEPGGLAMLYGLELGPYYTALLHRTTIPPDILQPHENHRNTPDVSGRSFEVLICRNPQFKYVLGTLEPGKVAKNAWLMRDEFLNLKAHPRLGWDWSARQFLNKWGLWGSGYGYVANRSAHLFPNLVALVKLSGTRESLDAPDFVMVVPHLLKAEQERYRKALLPKSARPWLRSHALNLTPADEFPFFRFCRSYCSDAIEATITIDHLAERQFGICKRCGGVFQKETQHEKNYCSERCFNAAGVQRWRENQRKAAKKGANRNAKG